MRNVYKKYLNEGVLKTVAFWINPDGQITGSLKKHINMIISDPKKFGLTSEYIDDQYKAWGERKGQEGKARGEIIRSLLFKGFTRIRKYGNSGYTIDVLMASKFLNKDYLTKWAKLMITKGIDGFKEDDKETTVTIIDMGRYKKIMTIEELANGKLYEVFGFKKADAELIIVENVHKFNNYPIFV